MSETVDQQYSALCDRILDRGHAREDRTGVGTISRFGERLDLDLQVAFPLLSTKRVFWKGVVRELLWFISGSTDANELSTKGVHIWDGNSSREYLDSRGLHTYPPGTVGPCYGWQWRSFGASYPASSEGTVRGVDQLADVIEQIKKNPTDRRLIVSAWNPSDLPKMALPPCHILYQFYVDNGELSCQMYQRSVDVGLGLPFNIASYALLTHMVAHVCGLGVGRLIMCLGDTHIYQTHVDALREQMSRIVPPLEDAKTPRVTITKPASECSDLRDITEADIMLTGYAPLSDPVVMKMAV